MRWFPGATEVEVPLSGIDLGDHEYNVCRPPERERLLETVKKFGALERPVLVKKQKGWTAVTGHGLFPVLKDLGHDRCGACILNAVHWEEYARFLLWKNLHGELSALGKLRVLSFVARQPTGTRENALAVLREGLHIPEYFLSSRYDAGWVESLPAGLARYLHLRDAGFKILKNLRDFPDELLGRMAGWIEGPFLTLNMFREIADLSLDIMRRDGGAETLLAIEPAAAEDPRAVGDSLLSAVRGLRYPRYFDLKEKADAITATLRGKGIDAAPPPFFEGDQVAVTLRVGRRDDRRKLKEKISQALDNEVEELLDLL
ncbi:MAG TPA: hypothetical protein ENN21_01725 [Spirochaetes bacterium]|nr:hypothetical protein [Spirochaetota bacterium]